MYNKKLYMSKFKHCITLFSAFQIQMFKKARNFVDCNICVKIMFFNSRLCMYISSNI